MTENKRCPFCGCKTRVKHSSITGQNYIGCSNANCQMPTMFLESDWNTRPIEDELRAEIERLKVRIEELEAAGTILRDCFSLHKPNWLIDKDAIKEWDELTKKECE